MRWTCWWWTNSTKPPPPNRIDTTGHGTHVASIAAGKTYGVAKKAHLVDCIVFDGDNVGTRNPIPS